MTTRILAAVAVLMIALVGTVGISPAQPPPPQGAPRVCFPRDRWNADPQYLPCARIVRLYEDGSMKIRVSDLNGTVRYSIGVGNPQG